MALTQIAVLAFIVGVVGANSIRAKRQLSPAVRLERELHPLVMGMYGFGPENNAYKRSQVNLKRHISPSFDVEEDVGNMRALMDIGKRQISVADDVGRQMQVARVGTVNSTSLSEKFVTIDGGGVYMNFREHQRVDLSESVADTDVKWDGGAVDVVYHRLFDAGKKRAALSPSQDLQSAMELSNYLERAGRK